MTNSSSPAVSVRSPLIRPFYPALDGLRALAFLAVFFVHYGAVAYPNPVLGWGWVGVDLFFVLSGFLITGILYDTLEKRDYFRTFYVRRALRIFPLFYGFWLVVLIFTPFRHFQWSRYHFAFVAYLGNFFLTAKSQMPAGGTLIFDSLRGHGRLSAFSLDHLWSLCVEEQFYLLWPAVVWFVRSRRSLLNICLSMIVLAPIGRALYLYLHPGIHGTMILYFNTFSRVDTLLVGAALALWLRGPSPSIAKLRVGATIVGVAAPMLLLLFWNLEKVHPRGACDDPMVETIGYTLIALTAAAVLLGAIGLSQPLVRALQWKPLAGLGRISYGLYFFHLLPGPFFAARMKTLQQHHLGFPAVLVALLYSIAAAWLSFRFFESKFLRLKPILAPDRSHVADPQPAPVKPIPVLGSGSSATHALS